ncbi:hypothetical protein B0H14DRAFT_2581246 [Mycena olivaceomarginata]|nr:hypothetical protein B0H14DRAFT_2581246 [Mycena olivaceomarginata]
MHTRESTCKMWWCGLTAQCKRSAQGWSEHLRSTHARKSSGVQQPSCRRATSGLMTSSACGSHIVAAQHARVQQGGGHPWKAASALCSHPVTCPMAVAQAGYGHAERGRTAAAAAVAGGARGAAQKQAGWMHAWSRVSVSAIGAQVRGAECRRKQVAHVESGEHAGKLVMQKRASGVGSACGGSTRVAVCGVQCGAGGTTGERMVCGADCAVVRSCEGARGLWASGEPGRSERCLSTNECMLHALARAHGAYGWGAGLGAKVRSNGKPHKSGSTTGQAGMMWVDKEPRPCRRVGQTSTRGGSTTGCDKAQHVSKHDSMSFGVNVCHKKKNAHPHSVIWS